ncbi:LysR substrate-binding domain-containing protein [Pseudomonas hefeiensis]|uniref:LysR substrate-binding domain-containing protein n=1 Tax=Pseudomonas hefeiensis TaxID=2738125 RepID=A0ABY9GIV0_9PSED|nr:MULTISPECIES: LysR substrate-binding domain-containing protein [unclassified Pseudomonas]WLH15476.1 LysR substrate-binding domain-containing protein [Pseudomonas sp. FP205]WLH98523.1 LysR substrate-binding domain-containing protein [Pseudomonas sp. FP53]
MNTLGKSLPPLASLLPFEAAARLESFSRAAEELHITQAAVSRQIRGLEESLGLKLFSRRNRAVFLTQEGRELGRVVSTALRSISDVADTLRQTPGKHRVVLLCQLCEAFYWLMPRLSSFHQQHPEIEIQVATSTRPLTEFNAHFDVALQSTGRASGAHVLVFTATDEVFPVCSPHYLNVRAPMHVSELARHTLLHHRTTPPQWMQWESWLKAFGQIPEGDLQGTVFDSYPLMLQAAVEGHGIALGWRRTAARLIDRGALVRPCAQSFPLPEAISVFRSSQGGDRVEVRALIEWLEGELESED